MRTKMKIARSKVANFFYINITVLARHIQNGVPLMEIYEVLSDKNKTMKQKKCYLYNLDRKKINTTMKDNLWERVQGDKNFINTSIYDSKYRGSIESFIGEQKERE